MLRKRRHLPAYPNGIAEVCESVAAPSSFGAERNPTSMDDLRLVTTLSYATESVRDSDQEFARMQGSVIDAKLRCPFCELVKPEHHVVIGRDLFSITRIDPSSDKREMYIYLSGGRPLGG